MDSTIECRKVIGVGSGGGKKQKEEVTMSVISMKKLLEVGVHFGHQTKRWRLTSLHQETGFISSTCKNHLRKLMKLTKQWVKSPLKVEKYCS